MNKYFDVKEKVYDITEKYPETIDVFAANGFDKLTNEKMRKIMGKTISLEMACKTKSVNLEVFEQKLVDAIEAANYSIDSSLITKKEVENPDLKIEGILPCPVRVPLLEGFNEWLAENEKNFDFKVDYELKSANLGVDWIKDRLEANDEEELSDLFISAGFDLFFDKTMMGKFKEKHVFEDMTSLENLNKDFQNNEIDLKDPKGEYSILAVVPAVFMVNTEELNGTPAPRSWADLLKPEFESRVSLPMRDFDLFNAILLNIYKRHGEDGVTKLGKSLLRSMHPAEMVKSHTKKDAKLPIVTIMPYFFTKMARKNSPLQPVWPEDGAIISPIFTLAKKSKSNQVKSFVEFFHSKEVGELLSSKGNFPSAHPQVDNNIPEENKFMWLGWDYINSNDIGSLIRKCEDLFHNALNIEEVVS